MNADRDFNRRMARTVASVAFAIVLLAAAWAARDALLLIYISALIAMGFSPIVRAIQKPRHGTKGGVPRILAILTIYVVIIAAIALLALLIVPPLVSQAEALWARLPTEFNRFQTFMIEHHLLAKRISLAEAVQSAPAAGGNAVGSVFGAIGSVIGGVFGIITILILSFYLLVEAESLFDWLMQFVPASRRTLVGVGAREAVFKVIAWLSAQFILAGVMGTFAAVGLGFMGVPYFYVVALIAAVGETIPIIGPVIGGITAVVVALTVSPKLALTVGIYFLILHQLEANILVPKIMEKRVGVSPVTVMVALLIGGALSGLIGAILAIPTAAILSVVVAELTIERGTHEAIRLERS
jgi:predicted PurR-regulated permease PerM